MPKTAGIEALAKLLCQPGSQLSDQAAAVGGEGLEDGADASGSALALV